MSGTTRRILAIGALAGLVGVGQGVGLGVGLDAGVAAQRPPEPGEELTRALALQGTRWTLPVLPVEDGRDEVDLWLANAGTEETAVLLLTIGTRSFGDGPQPGQPPFPNCDGEGYVIAARCVTGLAPWTPHRETIPLEGGKTVQAYSLAPATAERACAALGAGGGPADIAAFEQSFWARAAGAPIALRAWLPAADDGADGPLPIEGVPESGVAAALDAQGGAPEVPLSYGLPALGREDGATAYGLVDLGGECVGAEVLSGAERGPEGCGADAPWSLLVHPREASWASLSIGESAPTLGFLGAHEVVASSYLPGEDALYAAPPRTMDGEAARLGFPVAIAPDRDTGSELWVRNEDPAEETEISIFLWNSDNSVQRYYRDPVWLCPGEARRYDLLAIASELDPLEPAPRRPLVAGQPYLSAAVESLNPEPAVAPPISAVLLARGEGGAIALPGLVEPIGLTLQQRLRGRQGQVPPPMAVVPDVLIQGGPEGRTNTVLAIQHTGPAQNLTGALIDLYHEDGSPFLEGYLLRFGYGPAAFFDPRAARGVPGLPLPEGETFRGTAVVRSGGGRVPNAMAVVAFDVVAGEGREESASTRDLRRGLLVAGPALTAPPSPSPGRPTPTVPTRPTRPPTAEPTDVPTAEALFLPWLARE